MTDPTLAQASRRKNRAGLWLAALGWRGSAFGNRMHHKTAPEAATTTPVEMPATNANPATGPAPMPSVAPAVIAAEPDGGADMKELNHAYIRWVIQNRRHAKNR